MGIGTILLERGLISESQLEEAIAEQKRTGERLDHALVRLGHVGPDRVLEAIGRQFDMPIVDLSEIDVDPEVLQVLPSRLVFKQLCVPIRRTGNTLQIATCDPFELSAFDELRLLTGLGVELVLADERDLRKFIRAHYGVAGDTLDALNADDEAAATVEAGDGENDAAEEASVVKLVNDLLLEAIRERATDIHIEPYETELAIRYRIDGVLGEAGVPPTVNRFRNAIVSRLKIMASLNIAEKRRPQDGRITLRHKGREFDLRASIIPMMFGEGVVLRVLDSGSVQLGLDDLGMPSSVLDWWDGLITRPHGILLVTGPTGSGKSTTLYASLNRIVSDAVKAITVEDPVEYQVEGVNQIQVNTQTGLGFAAGLRDPPPRSGHHHDRRDPRPRDRRGGGPGLPDRPPRLLDAAHQRRRGRAHEIAGHGRRAVPRGLEPRGRPRPAARPEDLRPVRDSGPRQDERHPGRPRGPRRRARPRARGVPGMP